MLTNDAREDLCWDASPLRIEAQPPPPPSIFSSVDPKRKKKTERKKTKWMRERDVLLATSPVGNLSSMFSNAASSSPAPQEVMVECSDAGMENPFGLCVPCHRNCARQHNIGLKGRELRATETESE